MNPLQQPAATVTAESSTGKARPRWVLVDGWCFFGIEKSWVKMGCSSDKCHVSVGFEVFSFSAKKLLKKTLLGKAEAIALAQLHSKIKSTY